MKLFSFYGRSGRLAYLGVSLLAVFILAVAFLALYGAQYSIGDAAYASTVAPFAPVILLLMLPITWIQLAAQVRRCHDLSMSGWWIFLGWVPIVGVLFALFTLVWPGTREENEHGPGKDTPKDQAEVFS